MNKPNLDIAFDDLNLTPEARKVLNNYLSRLQALAGALTTEDQKELVRDIKEHLYNALEAGLKKNKSKRDVIDAQVVLEVLEALGEPEQYLESTQTESGAVQGLTPPRRLRRARDGRMLGGVAMGIANYLRIDVVLIRALMLLLLFTVIPIFIYPILWIIIPLETPEEVEADRVGRINAGGAAPVRRLGRIREGRVLGGVSTGIAAYFGVDVVLIRIAFLLLLVTGVSAIIYPVLWLIIPEASAGEIAVNRGQSPPAQYPG